MAAILAEVWASALGVSSPPVAMTEPAVTSPRPRDAATLVLVRRRPDAFEVLMGRRRTQDAWSELYVFPGGRVDPTDYRVKPATPLGAAVVDRLVKACTPTRGRALAVAAVRETWEETGLRLGKPSALVPRQVSEHWRGFLDDGLAPALDELHFPCRAITPPGRPRRFNARFFLAPAEAADGELGGTGELQDLRYVTLEQAFELATPAITRAVLTVLRALLEEHGGLATRERTPLFRTVNGQHQRFQE